MDWKVLIGPQGNPHQPNKSDIPTAALFSDRTHSVQPIDNFLLCWVTTRKLMVLLTMAAVSGEEVFLQPGQDNTSMILQNSFNSSFEYSLF